MEIQGDLTVQLLLKYYSRRLFGMAELPFENGLEITIYEWHWETDSLHVYHSCLLGHKLFKLVEFYLGDVRSPDVDTAEETLETGIEFCWERENLLSHSAHSPEIVCVYYAFGKH